MTLRISVIGIGYLGAVHAASMAELGHEVIGLDVDRDRVAALQAGHAPFHEPGFDELLQRGLDSGRLRFTSDYAELADADVHFLGLGTPQLADGMGADLGHLRSAIASLTEVLPRPRRRPHARGRQVHRSRGHQPRARGDARAGRRRPLDVEPRVPPRGLRRPGHPRPGPSGLRRARAATTQDERIAMLDAVYAPILERGVTRLVMGYEAAELVKVSANAFLATKISFINAVAEMCEATGADVTDISRALGMDDRIGAKFLRAGRGLRGWLPAQGHPGLPGQRRGPRRRRRPRLPARGGRRQRTPPHPHGRARPRRRSVVCEGRRITVLGAAFKPDSDDVRDSPALEVASRLRAAGARVTVTDPEALRRRAENRRACAGPRTPKTPCAMRSWCCC